MSHKQRLENICLCSQYAGAWGHIVRYSTSLLEDSVICIGFISAWFQKLFVFYSVMDCRGS